MMSRTVYKGLRIDWSPDECAAPLPRSSLKMQPPAPTISMKPVPIANPYALLDTESDLDSDSEDESFRTNGIKVSNQWADTVVA